MSSDKRALVTGEVDEKKVNNLVPVMGGIAISESADVCDPSPSPLSQMKPSR